MQVYPLKDVHNGAQCGFMFCLFYVQYIITVSVISCYSFLSVSVDFGYQLCMFVCPVLHLGYLSQHLSGILVNL